MSLRTRLQRLERNTVDTGCPACRDRRGLMVMRETVHELDGTVMVKYNPPPPCDRCGQIPESIIDVDIIVVSARNDSAALGTSG